MKLCSKYALVTVNEYMGSLFKKSKTIPSVLTFSFCRKQFFLYETRAKT